MKSCDSQNHPLSSPFVWHQFSDFSLRLTTGCWGALHLASGALLSFCAVTTWLQDPVQGSGVRASRGQGPFSDSRSPLCSEQGLGRLCALLCALTISSMEGLCGQNHIRHYCHCSSAVKQRLWCVLWGENYSEKIECLSTNINHYPVGCRYFSFEL